jgi:hypothetical protein
LRIAVWLAAGSQFSARRLTRCFLAVLELAGSHGGVQGWCCTLVAYFIFFVLHRSARTIDGLTQAKQQLKGDSVFGFSNLTGMLSALVSREHFDFDPGLFPKLLKVLGDDGEAAAFRIREKINLAQIQG